MGWEIAIVISLLGIASSFIYIGSKIELSLVFKDDLKYFFYMFALLFLLILSGSTLNILEINKSITTNSSCSDTNNATNINSIISCNTTTSFDNTSKTRLTENLLTNQKVLLTLTYIITLVVGLLFVVTAIKKTVFDPIKNKKKGDRPQNRG